MIEIVHSTVHTILALLQEMGEESARHGSHGLRGYPNLHDILPNVKKFSDTRWEEPFWDGLRQRLIERGIPTRIEVNYPSDRRKRCDLVIEVGQNQSLWIEGKLAMESWVYSYDAYYWEKKKARWGEWPDAVNDVGGKDLQKLQSLAASEAQYIGILLLGFDQIGGPLDQGAFYEILPKEVTESWHSFHPSPEGISWPDHYFDGAAAGFRDKLWFWYKKV